MSYSLPPTTGIDPGATYGGGMNVGGSSGGYGFKDFGSDFLSGLGKSITSGLGSIGSGGSRSSGSSSPYTDRTKDLLSVLLAQAVEAFKPVESTI